MVWGEWNGVYVTTSSTASTWPTWNIAYTSTAATTSVTWVEWNSATTTVATGYLTPRYLRIEDYAPLEPQSQIDRAAAEEKADALLQESLTPVQLTEYRESRQFTVISRDGQRRYLITKGRSGNVRLVNERGERQRQYCIHPIDFVPDEDTMLAQKLLLETDEDEFLRLANAS